MISSEKRDSGHNLLNFVLEGGIRIEDIKYGDQKVQNPFDEAVFPSLASVTGGGRHGGVHVGFGLEAVDDIPEGHSERGRSVLMKEYLGTRML